jgi:hypothetical protein
LQAHVPDAQYALAPTVAWQSASVAQETVSWRKQQEHCPKT